MHLINFQFSWFIIFPRIAGKGSMKLMLLPGNVGFGLPPWLNMPRLVLSHNVKCNKFRRNSIIFENGFSGVNNDIPLFQSICIIFVVVVAVSCFIHFIVFVMPDCWLFYLFFLFMPTDGLRIRISSFLTKLHESDIFIRRGRRPKKIMGANIISDNAF